MRYGTGHGERSRTLIVHSAGKQIRAKGLESVRLADMMRAAGMTNGGFYKHFESRDEVVQEAISTALTEVAERWISQTHGMGRGEALRTIIESYLSESHLLHPEQGCGIAALGSELARMPLAFKQRLSGALEAYEARLRPLMPGEMEEQRHRAFVVLFSSMAGCLTVARAEADEGRRSQILEAARSFFIRSFCEPETAVTAEATR